MIDFTEQQITDFLKDYRAICLKHGLCVAAHAEGGLLFLDEIVEPEDTDILMYSFDDNKVGHFFSYVHPLELNYGYVGIDSNGIAPIPWKK